MGRALNSEELERIKAVLLKYGDWAHGGDADVTAKYWANCGFIAQEVEDWLDVGVYCEDVADTFRDNDIYPGEVLKAAQQLIDLSMRHSSAEHLLSAICNGDEDVHLLIAVAKQKK